MLFSICVAALAKESTRKVLVFHPKISRGGVGSYGTTSARRNICAGPQERAVAARAGRVNKCLLDLAERRERVHSRRVSKPAAAPDVWDELVLVFLLGFLSPPPLGASRTSQGAKTEAWGGGGHFLSPLTPAVPPWLRSLSLSFLGTGSGGEHICSST